MEEEKEGREEVKVSCIGYMGLLTLKINTAT